MPVCFPSLVCDELSPASFRSNSSVPMAQASCLEFLLGVAVFDLNGLPKQCLNLGNLPDAVWIQMAFQSFCLKSLLKCCLNLKGFSHIKIYGEQYNILLVKQKTRYLVLPLYCDMPEPMDALMIQWAKAFQD